MSSELCDFSKEQCAALKLACRITTLVNRRCIVPVAHATLVLFHGDALERLAAYRTLVAGSEMEAQWSGVCSSFFKVKLPAVSATRVAELTPICGVTMTAIAKEMQTVKEFAVQMARAVSVSTGHHINGCSSEASCLFCIQNGRV